MEISITRYYDKDKNIIDDEIERADWVSYIRSSTFLSAETETSRGINPITREKMLIAPQPDVGYFVQNGKRIAIQYSDGGLWTECEWDDTAKSVLGQIARHFGAVLLDEEKEIIPI
jgi:hypothetical protein